MSSIFDGMLRDFKGIWIPREIWLDEELTVMEKLFIVEIDSLDNEEGCFASNQYFSKFFDLSKGRCSQIISDLEKKGIITIKFERDGKVITKRIIRVVNKLNGVVNKLNEGGKFTKQGYLENDEDNNILTNNTSNNNIINNTLSEEDKKTKKDNIDFNEIMTKWNAIPELANIKVLNDSRKKKIRTRIKETSLEELHKVIEKVASSKFLLGKTGGSWKANFDWILKPDKYLAILEGNYDDSASNRYSTTGKDFLTQAKEKEDLYADWDFSDKSDEQIEFIELEE